MKTRFRVGSRESGAGGGEWQMAHGTWPMWKTGDAVWGCGLRSRVSTKVTKVGLTRSRSFGPRGPLATPRWSSCSCQVFPKLELSLSRHANLSPLPKWLKSLISEVPIHFLNVECGIHRISEKGSAEFQGRSRYSRNSHGQHCPGCTKITIIPIISPRNFARRRSAFKVVGFDYENEDEDEDGRGIGGSDCSLFLTNL